MGERSPKVVVVGSFMMDLVIKAARRPQKGETLIGQQFGMFGGGKGNNQAIAAARLGGDVAMVGRLGRDSFGDTLMDALVEEGIEVGFVVRDAEAGIPGLRRLLLMQTETTALSSCRAPICV